MQELPNRGTSTYRAEFNLTDFQDGEIIWTGEYIAKVGLMRGGGAEAGSWKPGASRNFASGDCGRLIFIWPWPWPGANCGCQSAVQTGHNTVLDAVDLVTMTNDMAMKMAAIRMSSREIQEHGPLKIVVEPVRNQLTAEAVAARLRRLPGKFQCWRSNRRRVLCGLRTATFYRSAHRNWILTCARHLTSIPNTPSPPPSAASQKRTLRRSEYYLCVYELTDLSHRNVLWTDKYGK